MSRFFDELQRRNVIRVGIAYLAVAWLVLQVAEMLLPIYGFTEIAIRNTVALLAIGLLITLALTWIFEWTPDGIQLDADAKAAAAPSARSAKRLNQFIVAALVAAVAFFAVDKFVLDPARDAEEIASATDAAVSEALTGSYGDKSIAVLAFADMSPNGDQEYFGDGIAEELLNLLAKINELRVISRSTSFTFKGSNSSITEIADKLKVNFILEGSVRKFGERLRITAQLIDARSDTHVWSETYDRDMGDVFAIQDEISANIVSKLELTLTGGAPTAQRIDAAAYEKYLQASHIVHTSNRSRLREAQAMLNEVLESAPNYVPALNALGRLYYRIPKSEGMNASENYAEIIAIADRVVAIDPTSPSAYVWQGWLAFEKSDYQEAARFYEEAIRVDPNNTSLLRVMVIFLTTIGRPDDAITLGNYLQVRDPACSACASNLAFAYRMSGRFDEATEALQSVLNWHNPSGGFYWALGVSQLFAGKPEDALASFENEVLTGNREIGAIMALHDLERSDQMEARLAAFIDTTPSSEAIARIYAYIGDNDLAFEWLDEMLVEEGPDMLLQINTDLYDGIKSDPRWDELFEEHGIPHNAAEEIEFDYRLPNSVTSE